MVTRLITAALALALGATLVGCGNDNTTSPARYDAVIYFEGMAPHVGERLELRVVHADTGAEVQYVNLPVVSLASFTVVASDCLILGETYYVDFYADLSGNGKYDAPPVDHAWRRWIGTVTGPMTLTFTHDMNWTDVQFPDHG